jgi:WhiB family redox-sensing transcriptional regulator
MDTTIAYIVRVAEARTAWVSKARCRSSDPEIFFVHGAAQRKAVAICRHCPVVAECLAYALGNQMEFGVWGGMTERQRRALLKQHPKVVKFFAAQRGQTRVDQGGPRKALQGQPTRAAKRAKAMANSVEANAAASAICTSSTGTRPSPTCSTSSTTSMTRGVGERA